MYKIAIIGGGVVGGLIARAMSKYDGKLVILEKENDVAMGQSKANSGIVTVTCTAMGETSTFIVNFI